MFVSDVRDIAGNIQRGVGSDTVRHVKQPGDILFYLSLGRERSPVGVLAVPEGTVSDAPPLFPHGMEINGDGRDVPDCAFRDLEGQRVSDGLC